MTDPSPPPLVSTFVGERYREGSRTSDLISPPYDVISPQQRAVYQARNGHNIVRLVLPDGDDDRYERAAATLSGWRAEGVLVRDDSPSAYVVRQEFDALDGRSYVRTGVIAAVAVEPYTSGRVRPHERTHRGPKEDRLALMRSTRAMFEALLMMARDRDGALQEQLGAVTTSDPDVRADLEGVAVSMWRVSGADGDSLTEAAGRDDALYIADGHHRYETAGAYHSENPAAGTTLALIVPLGDPGLVVLPTHRVVHGESIHENALREFADDLFDVSPLDSANEAEDVLAAHRNQSTTCVVCLPGPRTFSLRLKPDVNLTEVGLPDEITVRDLDIARIDKLVVDNLVGIAGEEASRSYDASV
ncbi:MAG: DUF1015 domain-containing protein, partial [Gemmatimonadetes bacterium]|nr:DUF1015 domain-containing protein [Gemmatimonadota bacterium]